MATSGAFTTTNIYINYTITVTQNSQNIVNNTSNVTVSVRIYRTNNGYTTYGPGTCYCKINGKTYSVAMTAADKITNSGITIFTKTLDIAHDSNGAKTLACSAWFSHDRFSSNEQSYSQVLTTIHRASVISSITGNTIGSAVTVNLTKYNSAFTHKFYYSFGNSNNVVVNNPFTPSLNDCKYLPNSSSGVATIKVETYSGTTLIGSDSKAFTLNVPASVKPTCTLALSDPTGYLSTYGGYIQGMSKLKVVVTGTPAYSSPISSYNTTANGSTYTTSTFTTDVIKNSGSISVVGKVTDKRGRVSNSVTSTVTVFAYTKPNITKLSVSRCNQDGTSNDQGAYVKVTYEFNYCTIRNINKLSGTLKYKKSTDQNYEWSPIIIMTGSYEDSEVYESDGEFIFPADIDSSYDVTLEFNDDFVTVTRSTSVSTAFTFEHYKGDDAGGSGRNKVDWAGQTTDVYSNPNSVAVTWSFNNDILTVEAPTTDYARTNVEWPIDDLIIQNPGKTISFWCDRSTNDYSGCTKLVDLIIDLNSGNTEFHTLLTPNGTIGSYTIPNDISDIGLATLRVYCNNTSTKTSCCTKLYKPMLYFVDENDSVVYEPYVYPCKASMGLGKLAEFEGGLDIGFQTRLSGGLKYPVLNPGTNLNDVSIPNFYVGENIASNNYTNCPLTTGTFYLEVVSMGDEGQVRQRISSCSKTSGLTYERVYYQNGWGAWLNCYVGEEVIYNNTSGSNGTITLSTAASQYVYLDIFYGDNNNNGWGHTRVPAPNGKPVDLSLIEASSNTTTYFRKTKYTISGTTITPNVATSGYVKIVSATASTTAGTNYIKIFRVIGKR